MPDIVLTRAQLYQLVWSIAMQKLSSQVGVSDVAIAKTCRKARVPVPPRGYWRKAQCGIQASPAPLPPRGLGENDRIALGWALSEDVRSSLPDGAEPTEDLSEMIGRFRKRLGKFEMPRPDPETIRHADPGTPDPANRLASRGEGDDPFEHRRLQVLNALTSTTTKVGGTCRSNTKDPSRLSITIGDTALLVAIDRMPASDRLYIAILNQQVSPHIKLRWEDEEGTTLEQRLSEVFVEMAVSAELCRQSIMARSIESSKRRALEAENESLQRQEAAKLRQQQRSAAIEKAHVEALYADMDASYKAASIRGYISTIEEDLSDEIDADQLQVWIKWASSLADTIDPIRSGRAKNLVLLWSTSWAKDELETGDH